MRASTMFVTLVFLTSCVSEGGTVQHTDNEVTDFQAPWDITEPYLYDLPFEDVTVLAVSIDESGQVSEPDVEPSYAKILRVAGDDETYVMSAAVGAGSFGIFRIARSSQGRTWGVKQVSVGSDEDASLGNMLPTTSVAELRHELGLVQRVLGDRAQIHRVLVSGAHAFIVMTLWEGDLQDLAPRIPGQTHLLRSMLAQVSQDADRLHAMGFIHNDIRAANILWNAKGGFALWDFGIAQRVDADGNLDRVPLRLREKLGRGGVLNESVSAPEVETCRFGQKADSWSLGLAILHSFGDLEDPKLFAEGAVELAFHKSAYTEWYEQLRRQRKSPSCADIMHPDSRDVPVQHWYFAAMYHQLNKVDSELCDVVLQGMLVPDPADRWDMRRIATHSKILDTPQNEEATAALVGEVDANSFLSRHLLQKLRSLGDKLPFGREFDCLSDCGPAVMAQSR